MGASTKSTGGLGETSHRIWGHAAIAWGPPGPVQPAEAPLLSVLGYMQHAQSSGAKYGTPLPILPA